MTSERVIGKSSNPRTASFNHHLCYLIFRQYNNTSISPYIYINSVIEGKTDGLLSDHIQKTKKLHLSGSKGHQ